MRFIRRELELADGTKLVRYMQIDDADECIGWYTTEALRVLLEACHADLARNLPADVFYEINDMAAAIEDALGDEVEPPPPTPL